MSALLALIGKSTRAVLVGLVFVVVVFSFARVITRDLLGENERAETQLVVMHWSGEGGQEEDVIVEDALAIFEAGHPGIAVRRINPGDARSFYTKLQTMMAAGETPDVFYVGSERLPAFASAGLLMSIEGLLADDGEALAQGADLPDPVVLEEFYSATIDAFRFDGERAGFGALYGIPKDFTTIGFYCNLDLFEAAGLEPPREDWTWDDFIAAARGIGALPGRTGAEFVTWPEMLRLYLRTEGVDIVGDDFDDIRLRDPRVVEMLERLYAWRHAEPDTLTSGKSKVAEGASVFLTGEVGMAGPFGRWVVPSYRKIDDFRWDFVPMPRGSEHVNAVATVAWAISSRTEHPRESWDLVRALSSAETQARLARLGLAVPTLRSVAESSAFIDPALAPASDRAYLAAAEVARVIDWPTDPKFASLFGTRLDQAVKTGNLSVEEAIASFEHAWAVEGTSPLAREEFEEMPWGRLTTAGSAFLMAMVALLWLVVHSTRPGRLESAEERAGWWMASPLLIGLTVFAAFPIGLSFLLSFARWNGVSPIGQSDFVGLANYEQLLRADDRFRTSLGVTAYYALLAVPLGQLFALLAALLMNAKVRGIAVFRGMWYLPSVLAGVGVAVLWRWVFDGDNGLLNGILGPLLAPFGLEPPEWFGADAKTFGAPAFALMNLWMVGGSMMIYVAGLKGIPRELYEAAELDGAGPLARFRTVTLPMLSPVIFFNGIMAIIASFQVFTQALVMTGGEPGDTTRFYVLYLYNQAFEFYEMGYASAMAWMLLVIVLLLTVVVMIGSRRHVFYEAFDG
ncbi:MAG: extracellular solute-binding protein [bacterium]|nr:extracellular solute-binding protein [bacterium]